MSAMNDIPSALGYRLPAEWEPHAATWLGWPQNREDWPGKFGPIGWVYTEIVRLLSAVEPVHILIDSDRVAKKAADRLERSGVGFDQVYFHRIKTDRSWVRDSLPSFVVRDGEGGESPRLAAVDWRFNAWAKYEDHRRDERIGRKIAKHLDIPRWEPTRRVGESDLPIVLEGGVIDSNGQGTLLTTEECLLSLEQARNLDMSREDYERVLSEYLGIRKVIWLGRGIVGDDTHGHVDDIARFVNEQTVVTVVESDPADPNYEPLRENLERLQGSTDQDGRSLEVVTLPMPAPVVFDDQRLPASYANFYIANGLVIVPTFNDPADGQALSTLSELFPDRQVVGVHARDLVWGLGTLHCLTHEQPA